MRGRRHAHRGGHRRQCVRRRRIRTRAGRGGDVQRRGASAQHERVPAAWGCGRRHTCGGALQCGPTGRSWSSRRSSGGGRRHRRHGHCHSHGSSRRRRRRRCRGRARWWRRCRQRLRRDRRRWRWRWRVRARRLCLRLAAATILHHGHLHHLLLDALVLLCLGLQAREGSLLLVPLRGDPRKTSGLLARFFVG